MIDGHTGAGPHIEQGEPFASTVDEVLQLGWQGQFTAARDLLVALTNAPAASTGERALRRALLALVSAGLDDVAAARRLARQAISDSTRPRETTPADELRRLRLARALAANTSVLVGGITRGRRAAQARWLARDRASAWLVAARVESPWQAAPPEVQRYARFVAAVHERHAARTRTGPLTSSERQILHHLATGATAGRVAALLGRSPHTVNTHRRNAYAKLKARGRADALAKARALGLL